MKCDQARQLMDERLQALAAGVAEAGDAAGLDLHLAACPRCAADWRELLATRELLVSGPTEKPQAEEIEQMWTAVQMAMPTYSLPQRFAFWRGPLIRMAAGGLGVAACLALAFSAGTMRYGPPSFRAQRAPVGPDLSALSGAGEIWERFRAVKGRAVGVDEKYGVERFLCPSIGSAGNDAAGSAGKELRRGAAVLYGGYAVTRSEIASPSTAGVDLFAEAQQLSSNRSWGFSAGAGVNADGIAAPTVFGFDTRLADPKGVTELNKPQTPSKASAPELGRGAFGVEATNGVSKAPASPATPQVNYYALGYESKADDKGVTLGDGVQAQVQDVNRDYISDTSDLAFDTGLAEPRADLPQAQASAEERDYVLHHADAATIAQVVEQVVGSHNAAAAPPTAEGVYTLNSDDMAGASFEDVLQPQTPAEIGIYPARYTTSEELTLALNEFVVHESVASGQPAAAEPPSPPVRGGKVADVNPTTALPPGDAPAGTAPPTEGSPAAGTEAAQTAPRPTTRLIKTGQLDVEVDEYAAALEAVTAVVDGFPGAFVAEATPQEGPGGAVTGRIVIRMPPEHFEALYAQLRGIGRVQSEGLRTADVTEQYVDLEARIAGLQITEERLQELIRSKSIIDKLSSVLEVEREVTRVRTEIEQLQGQLRVLASRIALSTINLILREPSRTVPSAGLAVEVPVLNVAADALGETLTRLNGRLLSGKLSRDNTGALSGSYELQVPLSQFAELVSAIEELGRVTQRQVNDQQFRDAAAAWAERVLCKVGLTISERSRPLPAATITLEVDTAAEALTRLEALLAPAKAVIISNQTTRRDDGSSVIALRVRASAGQFAKLIEGLSPLGRITAREVSGEAGQIVGGAAEMLCDLALTLAERPRQVPSGSLGVEVSNFDAARKQLSAVVKDRGVQVLQSSSTQRGDGTRVGGFRLGIKSGDMEAVVAELEKLGKVVSRQTTGLGLGDLSKMDPAAVGVIELGMGERPAINPDRQSGPGSIRGRLRDGLAGLYASLGLILYGLVLLAPWLVLVVIGGWVVVRSWRRRAARKSTAGVK